MFGLFQPKIPTNVSSGANTDKGTFFVAPLLCTIKSKSLQEVKGCDVKLTFPKQLLEA